MATRKNSSGKELSPSEREGIAKKAFNLRLKGKTPSQIARELDMAESDVHHIIASTLNTAAQYVPAHEKAERVYLEEARLDALQEALWDSALYGDTKAVDSINKLINTRIKLFGLDQPDPNASKNTVLVIAAQEDEYIKTLKELADD